MGNKCENEGNKHPSYLIDKVLLIKDLDLAPRTKTKGMFVANFATRKFYNRTGLVIELDINQLEQKDLRGKVHLFLSKEIS